MRIWTHLALMLVSQVAGLMLGIWILLAIFYPSEDLPLAAVLVLVGAAAGFLIPHFLFRRLVPARCPACGGKAWCTGSRPIRYECEGCDYSWPGRASQGSGQGS